MWSKNAKINVLFFLYIYFSLSIINVLSFAELIEEKNKRLEDKNNERKISRHNIENNKNNEEIIINNSEKKLTKSDRLKSRLSSSLSDPVLSSLLQSENDLYLQRNDVLLSLGKETQQSSENELEPYPSSLAVDGNKDSDLKRGRSCSLTKYSTADPWWRVNLGERFAINKVKIINRSDCCAKRLKKYNVMVSDIPYENPKLIPKSGRCAREGGKNGDDRRVINVYCHRTLYGQYVTIYLNDKNATLQLCEVEVYGYKNITESPRPTAPINTNELKITINV